MHVIPEFDSPRDREPRRIPPVRACDAFRGRRCGYWWGKLGSVSPGNHPTGFQVGGIGDFNHDGFSDVLFYNPSNQHVDEWQLVNGRWAASVDIGAHGGTIAGVGDFDGNGTPDVLWNV